MEGFLPEEEHFSSCIQEDPGPYGFFCVPEPGSCPKGTCLLGRPAEAACDTSSRRDIGSDTEMAVSSGLGTWRMLNQEQLQRLLWQLGGWYP